MKLKQRKEFIVREAEDLGGKAVEQGRRVLAGGGHGQSLGEFAFP